MQAHNFAGISARDLQVWRDDRHVLQAVSLEASAGDLVHVAGPNGAGKTTLLRVIAGLLTPEQGSVRWHDRPIAQDRDAFAAAISYLGHSDGLKPDFTARENLAYEAGLRRVLAAQEIDETLARVGLSGARDQSARSLSAGQRRRLAMARVMLSQAALWILDEPFTNLDDVGARTVSGLVAEHLDAGGAALVAAHALPAIPSHSPKRVELG